MTCTKFFRTHLASPALLECHNNALGDITHSASPRALCSPRALLWHCRARTLNDLGPAKCVLNSTYSTWANSIRY